MQNPDEDTEWNDALRRHGIIPEKKKEAEITEEQLTQMIEETIKKKTGQKDAEDMTLDELDELDDMDDEREFEKYRQQRLAELKEKQARAKFGSLREISKPDYVKEVNQAGPGVWVVLFLYQPAHTQCKLLTQHLRRLAARFPATKFLQIVSTNCVESWPDRNLPAMFIYHEGQMKQQIVGLETMGGNDTTERDVEWCLKQVGAVESEMEENPRSKYAIRDAMDSSLITQSVLKA
eukprot:Clim_evm68s172 gene=Clim_evmTU68s172